MFKRIPWKTDVKHITFVYIIYNLYGKSKIDIGGKLPGNGAKRPAQSKKKRWGGGAWIALKDIMFCVRDNPPEDVTV